MLRKRARDSRAHNITSCEHKTKMKGALVKHILIHSEIIVGGPDLKRKYPTQPIVGVAGVIMQDGKLLIIKRGVDPAKGKWSIPGGAVEPGEMIREALIREVKEECGLNVEIALQRPLDAIDNIIVGRDGRLQYHYILLQFLVRLKGGTLKPASDVLDAKWVPLDEVEEYDLTRSFRDFFIRHEEELRRASSY